MEAFVNPQKGSKKGKDMDMVCRCRKKGQTGRHLVYQSVKQSLSGKHSCLWLTDTNSEHIDSEYHIWVYMVCFDCPCYSLILNISGTVWGLFYWEE